MAYCSECTYLKLDDPDLYGRFYCEKKYERMSANAIECGYFCRAYSRDSSVSRSAYEYSKDHSGSPGCYITTMLCKILCVPDKHYILESLRGFRNNYLQKNPEYKALLVEYDIIGPKIANALYNDPLRVQIAIKCLYTYIKPTLAYIKENKYNDAINTYIAMTNFLKELYELNNYQITSEEINDADITKSGHGLYIKKCTN